MHIAYYVPEWPPEGFANGIITYVSQMRSYLLEAGHQVTLFTQDKMITGDNEIINMDSRLGFFGKVRGRLTDKLLPGIAAYAGLSLAQRIALALQFINVDVVEIEESFGWSAIVQQLLRVPVIVRLHGPHYLGELKTSDPLQLKKNKNRVKSERNAIEKAFAISSPSAALLSDVVSRYHLATNLFEAVPNPVDVRVDSTWSLQNCDRSLILMVGRLDRRKGFDIAINAFSQFSKLHPDVRLTVVGPPGHDAIMCDDSLSTNNLMEPNTAGSINDRVDLVGLLSPTEITALRRKAFVTIMCSRFENFPYSAAEAMVLGCPFISTSSFHAEMFEAGVSGLVVDQEDHFAMAREMDWMFTHPCEAAAMGAAARERAVHLYSSKAVGPKMVSFYQNVIDSFRSRL